MDHRDAANCNLLFGLIALQNGLIDQLQLVSAFRAWTRDKARPLADHLSARGEIDADGRAAVEGMVALLAKKHGDDAATSLASIPDAQSTRDRLAALGDPDLTCVLAVDDPDSTRPLIEGSGTPYGSGSANTDINPDPDRTTLHEVGASTAGGQRFRILRPHAQGGLGVVFVALDDELHREVALKQIVGVHADDPASRQRFVLEAEITGGLEHPGIVPVYGLGTYGDGRPYYAMRFIRGDSLREAIARFHEDEALKADPGRRSLELRQLLRRFLDVCNAIDYAHSRGVLHRDIKPSNVIVGRHGETLVVDWGLAKAAGKADIHSTSDEHPLTPSSASGSAETLPGSAMGTPAYMSPEQARGDLDALGPRSDVYSLGATLYCLLTGKPPFDGHLGLVLRQVQEGDFSPPRRLDPSIDRAVEAVCLKAMATKPEDRYPTCRALADDIERWTADEPVAAWREPFARRARRWARRHRTPVVAAAAAVLVGVVALGAVAVQSDLAARRLAEKNLQLTVANIQVEQSRQRAEDGLRQAREAVDTYFTKVSESRLLHVPGLQPLRKELLDTALGYYRGFVHDRVNDPGLALQAARAQYKVGQIVALIGSDADALDDLGRARNSLDALLKQSPDDPDLIRDLASAENAIGVIRDVRYENRMAMESYARAVALRERLSTGPRPRSIDSAQLALSLNNLGSMKARNGRQDDGLADIRRAITLLDGAIRDEPADFDHRRDFARCHSSLVPILANRGEASAALAASARAREIYERLHAERPDNADYTQELAIALSLESYSLRTTGRPTEALAASEASIALVRGLVEANPRVVSYRDQLAVSYNMAGDLARQLGRTDDVGDFAVKARDIMEALHQADPKSTSYAENLSKAFNNLGRFHAAQGRQAEALAAFRRSIELRLAKPANDPQGEYNLACYLALALSVSSDADGPEREALATQAIAALRRAFAGGLTALEMYRTDSDLDSLHDRDDFRLLLMDMAMPKRPFAR